MKLQDLVITFYQRDPRWRDIILGDNPPDEFDEYGHHYTLGWYGCLITAATNEARNKDHRIETDPGTLNNDLVKMGAFEQGNGIFKWEYLTHISDRIVLADVVYEIGDLAAWLVEDPQHTAIVQVKAGGFPMHFVWAYDTATGGEPVCIDSWDGQSVTLRSRYELVAAHLLGGGEPPSGSQPETANTPLIESPIPDTSANTLSDEEIRVVHQLTFDGEEPPQDLVDAWQGHSVDEFLTWLAADNTRQARVQQHLSLGKVIAGQDEIIDRLTRLLAAANAKLATLGGQPELSGSLTQSRPTPGPGASPQPKVDPLSGPNTPPSQHVPEQSTSTPVIANNDMSKPSTFLDVVKAFLKGLVGVK